ncbi:MAG: restriction endonuclease subunit S [Treponema sp.]|nr:restriction endonuclease subunit S [Treponema sp.]
MTEWKKVKIGEIFKIEKGSLQSSKCIPGKYDFITAATDWKTHESYSHECEAIVYAVAASGSLGRAHYVKGKFIASDLCFILTEKNKEKYPINFLFYQLVFDVLRDEIVSKTKTGTSKESINQKNFSNYEIPYIPYDYQMNNYKKLVDAKKTVIKILKEIESQKTYAKQLRQNILQEAIEGKLTEEWRKENPVVKGNPDFDAESLFEKIQEEKCHTDSELLRNSKKKVFESISENEQPFEIPEGWKWVKLEHLAEVGTGATPLTSEKKYYENGTIPWITSSSTGNDFVSKADVFITEIALKETNCSLNPKGTLVVAMYGQGKTRGQITELCIEAATNQACATIKIFEKDNVVLKKYIKFVFKKMYEEIRSLAQGGTQPNLNLGKIANTIFPLPPLAEQKEIVSRVEKLLANVTELEKQITEREEMTKQLMQSIMKDAFREE